MDGWMDRHTRWKICSLRISCNRPLRSFTFCTISCIFPLSSVSILLVSPMAISNVTRTAFEPPDSQLPDEPLPSGVRQILCCPESAAEKVNRPAFESRLETTRWSLSKVSSTVISTLTLGSRLYVFNWWLMTSVL